MQPIIIKGAHENNLKHVDLEIQKNAITVFVGVSGSGKSSIAFDTVAVESQRQLNETFPLFIRHKLPHFERPKVESIENVTTAIVVDQHRVSGGARSTVGTFIDLAPLLRLLFSRCGSPSAGVATAYSFNSPRGMCPECKGLGAVVALNIKKLFDMSKSLNDGAIQFKPWGRNTWQWRLYGHSGFFDNDKILSDYSEEEWHNLLHGSGRKVIIENDPSGVWYEGAVDRFNRLYLNRDVSGLSKAVRGSVEQMVDQTECPACNGRRLNQAALASLIDGFNISQSSKLEISDLRLFLAKIQDPVGRSLAGEIDKICQRLERIGLSYLSLGRHTDTLSGGEAQRLKLVKHLGSSLTGVTYILDEPTAGLHPRDVDRIIELLVQLRDKGNSVIVVEHDAQVMAAADIVVEIGPRAGEHGGCITFQGSYAALLQSDTLTGHHLRQSGYLQAQPTEYSDWLDIRNARSNNLKDVSTRIPLKALTGITGVSGSGKSSLILGELALQHPHAEILDQRPVGSSSRSNIVTYLGIMDHIRGVFARHSGKKPSLFSFNSAGGCPNCGGRGEIEADMVYAEPVVIPCEECKGLRYSDEALAHEVSGHNIADVLSLTVTQALAFFDTPKINTPLQVLETVGLGYMTLGQPTSTMSGGEIQRMKLAEKLKADSTLLILDEPTTGLHPADIAVLTQLLQRIVAQGNTVIVIEHDMQFIAKCDWIIDLGPGGGRHGGKLMFAGNPIDLARDGDSITGTYLNQWIQRQS